MKRLVIMAMGAAALYVLQAQRVAPTPAGARMQRDGGCGCDGGGDTTPGGDLFGPPVYA